MPTSSCRCIPEGLSISQLQKFIPKAWKQGTKQFDKPNPPSRTSSCNESMIDSLLISLKNFSYHGQLSKAFETFSHIQLHTSSTASCDYLLHSISSLLLSCTNLKSIPQGKQLHGQIISLGLEQHFLLVPKLVSFYSSFNLFVEAYSVTETSNVLHPLPWNILISSYVRNEFYGEALSVYRKMVNKGIRPDNFTYPTVLKACGESFDLGFGKEVHKTIDACSVEGSLFVHNALVSMYGKFGEVDTARHLFDNMPERDSVSWNSMISCYASKGMWNEAFDLFERMRMKSIEENIIIWNTIAGGYVRVGNFIGALELISSMRRHGTVLDSVPIIIGLKACSHIGVIRWGKEIHGSTIRFCCNGFDNVQNALITMYARCKDLRHAYNLFQLIENKSIITWNSMLSGYTHLDRAEEASFLFREMLLSRIEPNFVTIASILPLCARVANLQHGREFHCYIIKHEGFEEHLLLWNALVDMYARSGKILEAQKVFDSLSRKDEVTFTSLIAGYGMQGEGCKALQLFEEMNMFQIKPDHITMIAILSACSHSGLINQGQNLFQKMQSVYHITPRLEHYSCMADLYGRAGLLNKAIKTIINMPYRPTPAMWATLIGACRIHGNTEIGEVAAEKLLEMRPENSGYYVLIANMYAAAGCWSKLANVRTFMRDLGVTKAPGCAWVDVGSGFFPFVVEDTSNPNTQEIYILLDGLNELMKDAGYVSMEGDFDLDDEDFEQ